VDKEYQKNLTSWSAGTAMTRHHKILSTFFWQQTHLSSYQIFNTLQIK